MIASFENELQKGTGLAFHYLKKSLLAPSAAVDKIIFENLATNNAYDPQCEGSRHEYIYNMLQFYSGKERIYSMVLDRFEKMDVDDYGERQIFGFVEKLVAEKVVAKERLYEKFRFYASKDLSPYSLGVDEIILSDKMDGIYFLAKFFGMNITDENRSEFTGFPFFGGTSERIGLSSEEVVRLLTEKQDSDVAKYLSVTTLENPTNPDNGRRELASEVMEKLRTGRPFLVRRWLKKATAEEVLELSKLFQTEKDLAIRKKLLLGFNQVKIDVPLTFLVSEFTKTRDGLYREHLIDAMLLFGDDSVLKLCDNSYNEEFRVTWIKACATFYNSSYSRRLRLTLEELDHNEIHRVTDSILGSSSMVREPIFHSLLWTLYRKNRCSICRTNIVRKIVEVDAHDQNFIEEIEYDCSEDTRNVASEVKRIQLTNIST